MILLCCKEINPNKQKNRMKAITKNGKNKLQLKGRIFMQNVTETVSLQKPGKFHALLASNALLIGASRVLHLPNFLER